MQWLVEYQAGCRLKRLFNRRNAEFLSRAHGRIWKLFFQGGKIKYRGKALFLAQLLRNLGNYLFPYFKIPLAGKLKVAYRMPLVPLVEAKHAV